MYLNPVSLSSQEINTNLIFKSEKDFFNRRAYERVRRAGEVKGEDLTQMSGRHYHLQAHTHKSILAPRIVRTVTFSATETTVGSCGQELSSLHLMELLLLKCFISGTWAADPAAVATASEIVRQKQNI